MTDPDPRPLRWWRRTLVAAGGLVMAYAVIGSLTDTDGRPIGQAIFLAGVLVAHDGVLMPLALGVGVLIGRLVPVAARPPVQVAALATLAVTVVALPLVLGLGRPADNPSALPLRYGSGLAAVLAVLWVTAVGCAWYRLRRQRRRRGDRP